MYSDTLSIFRRAVLATTLAAACVATCATAALAYTAPIAIDDPGLMKQVTKVAPSVGSVNGVFGNRMAVSGSRAVIAAYGVDSNRGAAYVFRRSGATWTQEATLTASDGASNDLFGMSVAISGNTVVVGAVQDDDKGTDSGSAYVFTCTGSTWKQQRKLLASDGVDQDRFGEAVAIAGDRILVGAPYANAKGNDSGAVYEYTRSGSTWTERPKLTSVDTTEDDQFGDAVAIDGDTALIGARANSDVGVITGAAYVFVRSGDTWAVQQKLLAYDLSIYAEFGNAVALSGDTAVIGAFLDSPMGLESGSAYVFARSGTAWTQQQKLIASDGAAQDQIGTLVAASGDRVLVSAARHVHDSQHHGAAYLYTRSGTTWTETPELMTTATATYGYFGEGVALSGDTALIGAYGDNPSGAGANSGSAFFFSSSYATPENTQLSVSATAGVLINDVPGVGCTTTQSTTPAHGTLNLAADGSFTYMPDAGWSGTDTFTYRVDDGYVVSNAATVTILVTADDSQAPTVTTTAHSSDAGVEAISIIATDGPTGSGVDFIEWKLDSAETQTVNSEAATLSAGLGFHTLRFLAQDMSGNASAVHETTFTVRATTTIVLTSTSKTLTSYGQTYTLRGTLTSGGLGLGSKQVHLQTSASAGGFAGTSVAGTTASNGTFAIVLTPRSKTYYRVYFGGSSDYTSSPYSGYVRLIPVPSVGTPKAPSKMSHTTYFTVYGYLQPRHPAGTYPVRIYKYRKVSGKWKSYGFVAAKAYDYSSYTKYSVKLKLTTKGTWQLRAYAPADSGHAAAWSSGYGLVTVK